MTVPAPAKALHQLRNHLPALPGERLATFWIRQSTLETAFKLCRDSLSQWSWIWRQPRAYVRLWRASRCLTRSRRLAHNHRFRTRLESLSALAALNDAQRHAVVNLDDRVFVSAGAGSGKTRVIEKKVRHVVRQRVARPEHVAVITFTNDATKVVRHRLRDVAGVTVKTIHGIAMQVIVAHGLKCTVSDLAKDGQQTRRLTAISRWLDEALAENPDLLFELYERGEAFRRHELPRDSAPLPVWCNKAAEARLVAGRSAAHGPCREPHPSPVSGGRRADPLSHRQMRILSVGLVGWPRTDVWSAASGGAETSSQFRDGRRRAPFRPTSATITGERARFRPLAPPVAVWAALCGGVARRGPAVGVAVSGSRPPGVVPPVQTSRPTAPPARPYDAVVRRTRRRGGTVRGAAVRAGWGRPPRGVACACCAREATSWSPAPSSSCSWMMLSRSKMARLLWPVRRLATRSGTLAPPRRPGPAPLGSPASDVARRPRSAGQLSRHGITARPVASVAE